MRILGGQQMRKVERTKIISAKKEDDLAAAYDAWFVELLNERSQSPMTRDQPVVILDRKFSVQVSGKTRTLYLVIFYEHLTVPEEAKGKDRGQHMDNSGFSAVPAKRR